MKNLLKALSLTLALVLFLGVLPVALADGSGEWTGIVIAQRITQRETKSLGGKLVQNISNGEQFPIEKEEDGWFYVDYNGKKGWVLSDYVVENPVFITLRNSNTYAYSYPNTDSKKVGSLVKYTKLPVISETDHFWVVNLRQASAFITKSTSVWTDKELEDWLKKPAQHATVNKDTTLRTGPGNKWYSVKTVKAGETVSVLGTDEGWYVIAYEEAIGYIVMADLDLDVVAPQG